MAVYSQNSVYLPVFSRNDIPGVKGIKYKVITGGMSIVLFVLFYPVLSGIAVNIDFVNQILEWLPTWSLAL